MIMIDRYFPKSHKVDNIDKIGLYMQRRANEMQQQNASTGDRLQNLLWSTLTVFHC